jgi:PAS domain S-box-containing protein
MPFSHRPEAEISQNLQSGEALYSMLFQNSLDGLMVTSPDGSVLDANPAACRIFGRTREEIVQEGRQGLIDVSDPRLAGLIALRARTGMVHGELTGRRKDGTLFPVEVSSVVFQLPDETPRTCMIIRDITDRKAAEGERELLRLWHE